MFCYSGYYVLCIYIPIEIIKCVRIKYISKEKFSRCIVTMY